MPGLIPGGVVAQLEEFHDFLALLRDPATLERAIQSIKDETARHDAAKLGAEQATTVAINKAAVLAQAQADAEAQAVAIFEKQDARERVLAQREKDLERGRSEFGAAQAAHAAAVAAHERLVREDDVRLSRVSAELDQRQSAAATQSAALDARAKELAAREQTLKQGEQDHAKRVAVLKQIVG